VLQAAIASLHSDDERDRAQIAALYGELARVTGSPVVQLNRAVSIAEAGDPAAGLELLETIDLDGYHYLHAARGELLTRLGRRADARRALTRALELVPDGPEERLLRRRLMRLEG
jgi:RNA polymerase sigma-70 factor (ECF subfamily)